MKQIIYIAIIIAIFSTISACKTTEQNYRAAYELAQQKKTDTDTITDRLINREAGPARVTVDGVSLPMKAEYTRPIRDLEGFNIGDFKKYNVVIASFRQLFNAESVRKRAIEGGFDKAFIVINNEQVYIVIAESCSTPAEAEAALKKVNDAKPVVMKSPYPYIMRRP